MDFSLNRKTLIHQASVETGSQYQGAASH